LRLNIQSKRWPQLSVRTFPPSREEVAMQQPSDIEFAAFYKEFYALTGINFNSYKQDQLQRRILNLADQRGHKNFYELSTVVLKDAEARTWLLDKLAINVTEVFRNPEQWDVLEEILKSEFLPKKRGLKIWSAGCSTGAEAYSLAAILKTHSPGNLHQIVGTDIDSTALEQAREGELIGVEYRHVPANYAQFFQPHARGATVCDSLKPLVKFHEHNLLETAFGQNYDLILCRNVLIYFVDEAKNRIYNNFARALSPGGYLFIGGSERIFNSQEFGFETPKPYFYRKPIGEIKWRNAS
jgi:chemotaxis protein methyltransferase CheR